MVSFATTASTISKSLKQFKGMRPDVPICSILFQYPSALAMPHATQHALLTPSTGLTVLKPAGDVQADTSTSRIMGIWSDMAVSSLRISHLVIIGRMRSDAWNKMLLRDWLNRQHILAGLTT